mmetsp:Transcript_87769/g.183460  ORF Transcript_87769/g.183460 Transcript_87769/m.183460 type:complete len:446 (-) Transcript_87769:57-1394(-)
MFSVALRPPMAATTVAAAAAGAAAGTSATVTAVERSASASRRCLATLGAAPLLSLSDPRSISRRRSGNHSSSSSPFLQQQCRGFARIDGYLHYYGKFKNQEGMLRDKVRVEAYKAALDAAVPLFKDATVMDIGTGSGILAMLAAKAGAKKVYAVEASPPMARLASRLARSNKLLGVVQVIPKHLEDVTEEDVPAGSVDIIVSELFSHFLVGELGLQAVTEAKRRFLQPEGLVLPAIAQMKLSPFKDKGLMGELRSRHKFWLNSDYYGIDLSPAWPLAEEQMLRENILDVVAPDSLLIPPSEAPYHTLDLSEPSDPTAWRHINFQLTMPRRERTAVIDGICGWWDALFTGCGEEVPILSTAPDAPTTVWAQCRFLLDKPMRAEPDDTLIAMCEMKENKAKESYVLRLELKNKTTGRVSRAGPIELSDVFARSFPKVDGPEPSSSSA